MINRAWMAYSPDREKHQKNFNYDLPVNVRVIPHGDYILDSFICGNYSYYQCNSGFFKKLHNSSLIVKIEVSEFELASLVEEEVAVFCPHLCSPQAGLTRGFKGTTSLDLKKQKHAIFQKWLNIPLADRPSLKTFEEVELKKLNEGSI